jgi:selenide,water dikinase
MEAFLEANAIKLTALSTAGGCGCKIEPAVLNELLSKIPKSCNTPNLLVGIETADDAAVLRINDTESLIFTNDFQTPIVNDPLTYGRVASANALSDVYAMGADPLMANAIVGFPVNKLNMPDMQEIMRGAVEMCEEAGIPLAGGHSIDNPQPIFGLAVVGLARTDLVKTNSGAKPGDVLILTKPIGTGILASAVKLEMLSAESYERFVQVVSGLNKIGSWLGKQPGVHAMTDITGFGLAGHLLEMARGAKVRMVIEAKAIPVIDEAWSLAASGVVPGGAYRNMQAYGDAIDFEDEWDIDRQLVYTDPQTNGGLLFAVEAARAGEVLRHIQQTAHAEAAIIGTVEAARSDDALLVFRG